MAKKCGIQLHVCCSEEPSMHQVVYQRDAYLTNSLTCLQDVLIEHFFSTPVVSTTLTDNGDDV
jgi:hypothetical protein